MIRSTTQHQHGKAAWRAMQGTCAVDVRGGDDVCLNADQLQTYLVADCRAEKPSMSFRLVLFKNGPEGTS